jgi:hypothetical protein
VDEGRQFANALSRHRLPEAMLKLLDRDPTGGAVKAELIGDSIALVVGCPDLTAFELSRSGHVRLSIT